MKKQTILKIVIVSALIAITVLGGILITNAQDNNLVKISEEKLKPINYVDSQVLFYNALQRTDMAKLNHNDSTYTDEGVLLEDDFSIPSRAQVNSQFLVKKIENGRIYNINTKDITVLYASLNGNKTSIVKVADTDNPVLIQNDPDLCDYNFSKSLDGKTGVIWNETGMWLVSAVTNNYKKITDNQYAGKTYDEIVNESKTIYGDETPYIYWNYEPKLNRNGSWIVYTGNRDAWKTGGTSIWIYNSATNQETVLVKNETGEYYNIVDWIDDDHFIIIKSQEGKDLYYIVDINGNKKELNLIGSQPNIINVSSTKNIIAYIPDNAVNNEIVIASIDVKTGDMNQLSGFKIDGSLRLPFEGFSPSADKYAFLFAPSQEGTTQIVGIIDIYSNTMTTIDKTGFSVQGKVKHLSGVYWNNPDELIILADNYTSVSTWIYKMGVK